jgi:hypothetical protein
MVHRTLRWGGVLAVAVAGACPSWAVEDAGQALPTLLIKGEIVSTDTNDPSVALIKVKDRYGFETPIYLAPDAKMTGEAGPVTLAALTPGVPVEVEYNFDINTAKRHAVSVKLSDAAAPAPAQPPEAAAPASAAASPQPAAAAAPAGESKEALPQPPADVEDAEFDE